jgi:hypothetical protein
MKLQIYSSLPKEKYINKHEFYKSNGPLVGQGVISSLGRLTNEDNLELNQQHRGLAHGSFQACSNSFNHMSPASTDLKISNDMVFTLQSKHNNVVINPWHKTFLEKRQSFGWFRNSLLLRNLMIQCII